MYDQEDLFKAAEDESLDSLERSRAVEFLAMVDDPRSRQLIVKCLKSSEVLVKEAAAIAAMIQWDFDVYNIVMEIIEDDSTLESIKMTCKEALAVWCDTSSEVVQRFQKIRDQMKQGNHNVELIEFCGDV